MPRLFQPASGESWNVEVSGKTWSSTHGSLRWEGGDDVPRQHLKATSGEAETDAAAFTAGLLAQGFVALDASTVPHGFPPFTLWSTVAAAPVPGKALRAMWGALSSKAGLSFEVVMAQVRSVTVAASGLTVKVGELSMQLSKPFPPVALEEGQVPEAALAMLELHARWECGELQLGLDLGPPQGDLALEGTDLEGEPLTWVMKRGSDHFWVLVEEGETSSLYPYHRGGPGPGLGEAEEGSLESVFFRELAALLG